jgi:hypothetical protein
MVPKLYPTQPGGLIVLQGHKKSEGRISHDPSICSMGISCNPQGIEPPYPMSLLPSPDWHPQRESNSSLLDEKIMKSILYSRILQILESLRIFSEAHQSGRQRPSKSRKDACCPFSSDCTWTQRLSETS